ncbi:hypothetical protein DFH07DRAFT_959184 [Mycena maculata]|uniref:Uncharacterized protein n=1 Tax=Mycena maculata TaxID=230809 RepID=A0AAD7NDT7_9AGAR|nr:hypothetical protein DFH07DRAFT_959184 [Mycena maculata]
MLANEALPHEHAMPLASPPLDPDPPLTHRPPVLHLQCYPKHACMVGITLAPVICVLSVVIQTAVLLLASRFVAWQTQQFVL